MKQVIVNLVNLIKNHPDFIAVMGEQLYPLAAPEGVTGPFALYSISSEPLTKDGRQYNAGLQLFFPIGQFDKMLDFADVCVNILRQYDVGTVETDYSNDYKSLFTTINFIID